MGISLIVLSTQKWSPYWTTTFYISNVTFNGCIIMTHMDEPLFLAKIGLVQRNTAHKKILVQEIAYQKSATKVLPKAMMICH